MFYQIIVAYDIEDTKKRTKLFETLKDFGLISIQKSVMWGYINYAEEKAIREEFKSQLGNQDKSIVLRVTNADQQIKKYGMGYEDFNFDNIGDPHVL